MGRAPCCDKANVKKGPWSSEEDSKLKEFIEKYGTGGNWIAFPQKAGLKRCGKSCRLRWLNYLRPNIKHGEFSDAEDRIICTLFASIGSRWSIIAAQLPGRTDNDIKNYWNTKLKKKLMGMLPSNQRNPLPSPPPIQTPLYRDFTSYYDPAKPLTGLEPSSLPPNLLNNFNSPLATNSSLLQTQESFFNPMQYNYTAVGDSLLVFGGDQASCSSSDGSCSQISHGKEIKQEDIVLQSYMPSGFEENQKFMIDYGNYNGNLSAWSDHQKPNGYFGNSATTTPLGSGLASSFFFFNDENKTREEERTMYQY